MRVVDWAPAVAIACLTACGGVAEEDENGAMSGPKPAWVIEDPAGWMVDGSLVRLQVFAGGCPEKSELAEGNVTGGSESAVTSGIGGIWGSSTEILLSGSFPPRAGVTLLGSPHGSSGSSEKPNSRPALGSPHSIRNTVPAGIGLPSQSTGRYVSWGIGSCTTISADR